MQGRREFDQKRRDYQQKVDELGRADILFLMDATESMNEYFPSTAQAINEFSQNYLKAPGTGGDIDLRVGVAIFGDYKGTRSLRKREIAARCASMPRPDSPLRGN